MKSRMRTQKVFDLLPPMNRMLIPDQHNRASDATEQGLEKDHDFITSDGFVMGVQMQLDLPLSRTATPGPHQVQPRIVLNTGANHRRLTAWGPSPFEWGDQRKPTFVEKNEGCAQVLPLFLSVAKRSVSNEPGRPRPDARRAVAVFDNSSPAAVRDTKWYSIDSAPETNPKPVGRCALESNSRQHIRNEPLRVPAHGASVADARMSDGRQLPAGGGCVSETGAVALSAASGEHSVQSLRCGGRLVPDCTPAAISPALFADAVLVVDWFRMVSCA